MRGVLFLGAAREPLVEFLGSLRCAGVDRDFGATISIRRIIRRGYRDNSRFFKTNLTRAPAGLGVSARWLDCGLDGAHDSRSKAGRPGSGAPSRP